VDVSVHTGDSPGICLAPPGAIPIEVAHFSATILIDVEISFRAGRCVLATTRVDLELVSGINLVVLNVTLGNFGIFVVYTGIVVKIRLLGTMTQGTRNRRLTILVELSPLERDVLDGDCFRTGVDNADDDPLGIRLGADIFRAHSLWFG
jgi:hypothetical protein